MVRGPPGSARGPEPLRFQGRASRLPASRVSRPPRRRQRSRTPARTLESQPNLTGRLQFLRELHFIEASWRTSGSLNGLVLQFLRELHFIEAVRMVLLPRLSSSCSSFGNCTSLRLIEGHLLNLTSRLQFLRELHFIEAGNRRGGRSSVRGCSSFGNCTSLRRGGSACARPFSGRCSSFGNCTSLRQGRLQHVSRSARLQFLWELHFIEAQLDADNLGGVGVAVPLGTALH